MHYRILGPITVAERPVRAHRQQARVLASLLLESGSVVSSRRLAWWALGPERSDEQAQIQVLVSRIRRELRSEGDPAVVVTSAGGYCLDVDADLVDARAFERLGSRITAEPRDADVGHLAGEALALWRGEPAAGLGLEDHPVVRALMELRLAVSERQLLDALARRVDLPLADVVGLARRHPGRERLTALVMLAPLPSRPPARSAPVVPAATRAPFQATRRASWVGSKSERP